MDNKQSYLGKNNIFRGIEWKNLFVVAMLLFLVIAFGALNKNFLSFTNFAVIGRQTAAVAIIAFGMTFIITAGYIDLSVGAIVGLSGMLTALSMRAGANLIVGSLVGLLTGLLIGFMNGIFVAKFRIPSFLATLGTMSIVRGISMTITGTLSVKITDKLFTKIWSVYDICGIPTSVIWMVVVLVIAYIVFNHTAFGNRVKAVGGNRVAAIYSGINADKISILVFVMIGVLSGIAGLMMCSRLGTARPEVGEGMELDAVAAVILGGTAIEGGSGKMLGTLIGALIMTVLGNGLIILGIDSNIQEIVKGIIIIISIGLSVKRK